MKKKIFTELWIKQTQFHSFYPRTLGLFAFRNLNQNRVPSFPLWLHLCVCVCVFLSRAHRQIDWKSDRDRQSVKSSVLSLPAPPHCYADKAFQLLSMFSLRGLWVCLRLKATVCTKVLFRAGVWVDCFCVAFQLVSRHGFFRASLRLAEGHTSPQGLNTNRGSPAT